MTIHRTFFLVVLAVLSASPVISQQTKLVASDSNLDDWVGTELAAEGRGVFASSPRHSEPGLDPFSGAVFVFLDLSNSGDWSVVGDTFIVPAGLEILDRFGSSISLDGRTLVVGATGDDDGAEEAGCLYVIRDISAAGDWSLTAERKIVPSDAFLNMLFGGSVSVSGRTIVAGAEFDDPNGIYSGSVYVFQDTSASGDWSTFSEVKIDASDGYTQQQFGTKVSIGGDRVFAVGVPYDDGFGLYTGAVYIYRDTSAQNDWSTFQEAKLIASDTEAGDFFGLSLAFTGHNLVVGAPWHYYNFHLSGVVYLFQDNSPLGDWSNYQETVLAPSDPVDQLQFGYSVDLAGREILVGGPSHNGKGVETGAAYSFIDTSPAGDWSGYMIDPIGAFDANAGDRFGYSVALVSGADVMSAPEDINQNGQAGSVYVVPREILPIFSDGFECGDTSAWSTTVPATVIVINEIMQNPVAVSDAAGEWFELFNPGASPVDINGWTLSDNGADTHVIANGGPLFVPAGGYLVMGAEGNSGANGGVTIDYVYTGIALGNSADEIVLSNRCLNEIDRVEWDGGATFPNPVGASMSLANPGLDNNDGANWCTSTTPYGDGDLGTPGQANEDCGF